MEILEKDGLGGNISRGYGSVEFEVEEFQSYDIRRNPKGGFKIEDDQQGNPLSCCQGKIDEIVDSMKG